jgi:RNA polymerase sigma factor (sigma-70 family)
MITSRTHTVLGHLHRALGVPGGGDLTDRQLLERYTARRDEAAFAALVRRHGPMVLGVCRRVLRREQDAEDAFQATFLALARRADATPWRDSVGGWLHDVAYRVATKLKVDAARRHAHERLAGQRTRSDATPPRAWEELGAVLDEEVRRLPEPYRAPLLLCYFEGRTRDQAARQLGWSLRTLERRLGRGRERLRGRLARRGVTLGAALLAPGLASGTAGAAVAGRLAAATARAAAAYAAGPAGAAGGVSAQAAALAEGVLRATAAAKLKLGALVLLALTVTVTAAAGLVVQQALAAKPPPAPRADGPAPSARGEGAPRPREAPRPRTDREGEALPDGAVARLGTTRFRHGYVVWTLAFSPDGQTLASGGQGRGLCLWDARTGRMLHHCASDMRIPTIYSAAFSPDGKTVATAEGQPFRLWDVATGKEIRRFTGHENGVMAVAFSPDGKTLASGSHDKTVRLWEAGTGKQLLKLEGHTHTVVSVAFSPDGRTVASASWGEPTVRLWDVGTGKEVRQFRGHQGGVHSVAFAPDGKTLAAGGGKDQTVRLWDVGTGKELHVCGGGPGRVPAVAFSPDGKTLASAHNDRTIRLYDVASGKERRRWEGHATPVSAIAFAPDGKVLASGAVWESAVRLWDPATGEEVRPSDGHTAPVDQVGFAPDGKTLFSRGRDMRVLSWDLAAGTGRRGFGGRADGAFDPCALSPDGKTLATGGRQDLSVRLWEVATGKELRLLGKHADEVRAVAFAADGRLLASVGKEGTVILWEVPTGKEVRRLMGPPVTADRSWSFALAFAPDGRRLVSGGDDRVLHLWDVAGGKELRRLDCGVELETAVFSPDGTLVAAAGGWPSKSVWVWDAGTGAVRRQLEGHQHSISALAFAPDGKVLASAGDERENTIRLWELATGQQVRQFEAGRSGTSSLAFAPDGRALASGAHDATVLVWDVTGRAADGRARPGPLAPRAVEDRWSLLAGEDAAAAYQAAWDLAAAPRQAVPFLRQHLAPAAAVDAREFARLVADLGSDTFEVRERATARLEKLGYGAEPALREVLKGEPPFETRRRVERLLEKLLSSREWLRVQRAVRVLELIGDAEARRVLQGLARGVAGARLTQEARASLDRLARRTAP